MLACEFVTPKGTKNSPLALVKDAVETVAITVATTGALALATFLTMLIAVTLRAAPLQAAQPVRGASDSTAARTSVDSTGGVALRRLDTHLASALPFLLAENATLRTPGSSRFAGHHVGAATVDSVLSALCAVSVGSITGVQHFAADDRSGALLLLRSARAGSKRIAWHEVVVYHLDDSQRIRALDFYVEDQRSWDRRFPREDGVNRVSIATERNVDRTRAELPAARFVAGNADRVLVVLDAPETSAAAPGEGGRLAPQQTVLLQRTIAPTGGIRSTATYRPTALATQAGVLVAR